MLFAASIRLRKAEYGTHALRRTKAAMIYRATGNIRAIQTVLGHTKIENTVRYLGVEVEDALLIKFLEPLRLHRPVHGTEGLPRGPMFLKDFGVNDSKFFSSSHVKHKIEAIETILSWYPGSSSSWWGTMVRRTWKLIIKSSVTTVAMSWVWSFATLAGPAATVPRWIFFRKSRAKRSRSSAGSEWTGLGMAPRESGSSGPRRRTDAAGFETDARIGLA